MTIQEAYLRFLDKVNRNSTNDNVVADKARFIFLFNEVQNRYFEWLYEKQNEDDFRYMQSLLVYDEKLSSGSSKLNHSNFKLPEDYFLFSNLQIFADSDGCKNKKLLAVEAKQADVEELYCDANNCPSFPFRETFYTFGNDEVAIYFKDFDVSKVYLTYYRCPKQVDIAGYRKFDKTSSVNCDPEFNDKIVNRILNAVAQRFNQNTDNLQKIQFDKDSVISKI